MTSEKVFEALEKDLISEFYEEEFHLNQNVFQHIMSPNFDKRVSCLKNINNL